MGLGIKKVLLAALIGLFTSGLLSGCGEREELTTFQEEMTLFYTGITEIEKAIEGIAADSPDAVTSLLSSLNSMEQQFAFLSEISVPREFASIEELADDGAEHMRQAVAYYHQAYEGESFDENLADAAAKHYESAMKRVEYIAALLQGRIPKGANVIVTDGDDTEFAP